MSLLGRSETAVRVAVACARACVRASRERACVRAWVCGAVFAGLSAWLCVWGAVHVLGRSEWTERTDTCEGGVRTEQTKQTKQRLNATPAHACTQTTTQSHLTSSQSVLCCSVGCERAGRAGGLSGWAAHQHVRVVRWVRRRRRAARTSPTRVHALAPRTPSNLPARTPTSCARNFRSAPRAGTACEHGVRAWRAGMARAPHPPNLSLRQP